MMRWVKALMPLWLQPLTILMQSLLRLQSTWTNMVCGKTIAPWHLHTLEFARELIKHTYYYGWKLPLMP